MYDEPLFAEAIVAWEHGPVIKELWQKYKCYRASPIPSPNNFDGSIYTKRHTVLLNGVYSKLGNLDPYALREQTHKEPTWINAYPQGIITQEAMRAYFCLCIEADNLQFLVADSSKYEIPTPPLEQTANFSGIDSDVNTSKVKSDVGESEVFKAFLASEKDYSEVYRRLAES